MANMFGGSPQNGYSSSYGMQSSGIPVYNMATKEGAEQNPVINFSRPDLAVTY